jgi:hypothetical protein
MHLSSPQLQIDAVQHFDPAELLPHPGRPHRGGSHSARDDRSLPT